MCQKKKSNTPLTAQDEIATCETGDLAFAPVASPNFGAFHSNQSEYGAKKPQTDRGDHQPPACLDVACEHHQSRQRVLQPRRL